MLFPFPPEFVAHTAFMFDDFFLAVGHIEQLLKNEPNTNLGTGSVLAEAMPLMGESIKLEDFQHKLPSLTECS